MTQKEFAEWLGVHAQSIKRWEHGCVQDESMDQLIRKKTEAQFSYQDIPKKAAITRDVLNNLRVSLFDVADFIACILQDYGEYTSPMKLQKLAYYTQGWFLAFFDRPLFMEDFLAWPYGPANRELYNKYSNFRRDPIPEVSQLPDLPEPLGEHINNVLNVYAVYTAYGLGKKTHEEKPWLEARGDCPENAHSNTMITKESMKAYYRSMHNCCRPF